MKDGWQKIDNKGLCHRKWLMLYFLKFQVNKQRNTAIMQSDNGKLEKKPVFFTMLCRENNLLLFSLQKSDGFHHAF